MVNNLSLVIEASDNVVSMIQSVKTNEKTALKWKSIPILTRFSLSKWRLFSNKRSLSGFLTATGTVFISVIGFLSDSIFFRQYKKAKKRKILFWIL
jgi:uncharacterized membrane protein